jgi:poly-gamma-glutamate biosynthesis protein PgsC/CapC
MDAVTVSLAVGLMVTLAVTEVFGFTAGGMIVPGYFALFAHQPATVAITLLVALATFGVVRNLSRHMIVYGRRRIVLMLLFGFLIGSCVRCFGAMLHGTGQDSTPLIGVVGFIVPGLIALWFDRQGVAGTLGSLATSSAIVRLVLIVIGTEIVL